MDKIFIIEENCKVGQAVTKLGAISFPAAIDLTCARIRQFRDTYNKLKRYSKACIGCRIVTACKCNRYNSLLFRITGYAMTF